MGSPAPQGRALLVALTPESRIALGAPERDIARFHVSREHFEIDRDDAGCILVDRASTCGTIVEGQTVGDETRGGTLSLRDGDVIIVGTSRSPYAFKFRVG